MMPVYRYMDSSYPHQRHQNGYQQPFPAYIPINPSKPPMVYESWPYSGNYGFPNPMPYNSCCNHGNLPGFHGFRPSCPHPMPSPEHYCGGCPVPYYPDPNSVYYIPPPPPHYTVEMPRYEYDKSLPRNQNYHCCECPNHHHIGDGGVKIQEQEPNDAETKGNRPLVPVRMKGFPRPVVWIPEEYAKENVRPFEAEEKKHESIHEKKHESLPRRMNRAESLNSREQEPNNWNGWFPLDRDKIKYLTNGGARDQKDEEQKKEFPFPLIWMPSNDGRQEEGEKKENKSVDGDRDRKNEDPMRQFPFPIIWMHPQDNKQDEVRDKGVKEANTSPKLAESLPYVFNFVPMKHLGENNISQGSKVSEENASRKDGTEAKEKAASQKDISVKQIDPQKEEEKKSEEDEKQNKTSKASGTDGKRQSSLSPKSSDKLPPVCLRVDPLPKKKSGNGSSRSPSPPRSKGYSQQNLNGTIGASKESAQEKSVLSDKKEVEPKKTEAKEILVRERTSGEPTVSVMMHTEPRKTSEGTEVSIDSSLDTDVEVSEKPCIEKAGKDGDDHQTSVEMAEKAIDSAKSGNEKKPDNKILSDAEAALRIQSAYRGFEMRRSQPLKKLKQIAVVREQVADVQNRIQALESSSDLQKDDKQKLVLGETIMRLLLKLDTIQGLHPSLRDVRKSLAKELVTLQEKLDSLAFEPEKAKLGICNVGPVEEVGVEAESKCKREKPEEKEISQNSDDVVKSGKDQILPAMESEQRFEGDEKSLASTDSTLPGLQSDGVGMEDQVGSDVKLEEANSEATVELKDEVREVCATESMQKEAVDKAPTGDEAREVPLNQDGNISDVPADSLEANDVTSMHGSDIPKDVADDEQVETQNDVKQVKTENVEEVESVIALEATSPSEVEEVMATEIHELAELPIGVIDEDGLLDKESNCLGTTEMTLPQDATLNEIEKPKEALEEKVIAEVKEELKAGYEKQDECSFPSETAKMQPRVSLEEEGRQIVLQEGDVVAEDTDKTKEIPVEEDEHVQEVAKEEAKEETKEMEAHATDNNMNDNQPNKSETTNEEVLGAEEFTPLQAEQGEESTVASQTSGETSDSGSETGNRSDKQLVEENEKLREMMEKLIEAGQQQLNVISTLNRRVKDLEKRLSNKRKKKVGKMCSFTRQTLECECCQGQSSWSCNVIQFVLVCV